MTRFAIRPFALLSILSLVLLVTRFNHFGSPVNPPDATLAVLFLAGWYLGNWQSLAILLALAGLADALSIAGGVSPWCVTPAYWFLVPAYAALWLGGRWACRVRGSATKRVGLAGLALLVAVVVFFAISNASFYLLSGYFGSMPPRTYTGAVVQYLPRYLENAGAYVLVAAIVDRIARFLMARHRAAATEEHAL